jgi:ubiquinone/menaquinone biosynthesis C-methylase UbiE
MSFFPADKSSMSDKVDLYKTQYTYDRMQIYRQIRAATYGQDLGQSSWITLEEAKEFLGWLGLDSSSKVLEVACGVGGVSCLIASQLGTEVHGIDISQEAVNAAISRSLEQELGDKVRFSVQDASNPLDFPSMSFEAIFCNDSINHLDCRDKVFGDWWRLLAPNGKVLFTDPILVTGILSNEEIRRRSSIGFYLYTPEGENERLLKAAGFRILKIVDVTCQVETVSKRWHTARQQRRDQLLQYEELEQFDALQDFLSMVYTLAAERRLSRFAYLAQKEI